MIYQGSNSPIVITFDEPAAGLKDLSIGLYDKSKNPLKTWNLDTVEISGNDVTCPLTQEETSAMEDGYVTFLVKWSDGDGDVIFAKEETIYIYPRSDKIVRLEV